MIHYKKIKLTHANLQRPLNIVAGTLSTYFWNEPTKSMVVCTTSGIYPVAESEEQIDAIIESLNRLEAGNKGE